MKHTSKKSGFTLVELAIVLVIIGLIVGGVLAGADLIKSAAVQKAIKQVGDVETGANTFRTKYNALPGDLKNPGALFNTTIAGADATAVGLANGDGLVQFQAQSNANLGVDGEAVLFFPSIAFAGYIKDAITFPTDMTADNYTKFWTLAVGTSAYLAVGTDGGKNYIAVIGTTTVPAFAAALSPQQASNFDSKLDDGVGNTGLVLSIDDTAPALGTFNSTSGCTDGSGIYQVGTTATTALCNLSIRTSF